MNTVEGARVDPDNSRYRGRRPWQYEWLSAGLGRNHPGFDGGWPWWLSCQEPDLDQCRSAVLPGGRDQALIELDLSEDRCLVFPLWMWETIHSGLYLAACREEFAGWYGDLDSALPRIEVWPLPQPWRDRIELSWDRIFDRDRHVRFWYRDGEVSDDDSAYGTLAREASEEEVALTQVLAAGDVVNISLFSAAG